MYFIIQKYSLFQYCVWEYFDLASNFQYILNFYYYFLQGQHFQFLDLNGSFL